MATLDRIMNAVGCLTSETCYRNRFGFPLLNTKVQRYEFQPKQRVEIFDLSVFACACACACAYVRECVCV